MESTQFPRRIERSLVRISVVPQCLTLLLLRPFSRLISTFLQWTLEQERDEDRGAFLGSDEIGQERVRGNREGRGWVVLPLLARVRKSFLRG